ncbi:MAG: hypothetical protein WCA35_15970 [Kovacikia sp.]
MKAYSVDLRQKNVDAYEQQEGSQRELAEQLQVLRTINFVLWGSGDKAPLPAGAGLYAKVGETLTQLNLPHPPAPSPALAEGARGIWTKSG